MAALGLTVAMVLVASVLLDPASRQFPETDSARAMERPPPPESVTTVVQTDTHKVATLDDLLGLTVSQRAGVDIARANLLVAREAVGGKTIDIQACLSTLDRWAATVAAETDRHLYRFVQNPSAYEDSEGYFRMLMLVTVLQQDFGVRYNPERITDPDFTNPGDLFIHGMIGGDGGTCVSMPVLYTAVARRLGYPVNLVTTKAHLFARWEGEERFNIEAAGLGLRTFDDEYYKSWPLEVSDAEAQRYGYLESLDADAAIAVFVASLGHLFHDTSHRSEALGAYRTAATLDADNPLYTDFAGSISRQAEMLGRIGGYQPPGSRTRPIPTAPSPPWREGQ